MLDALSDFWKPMKKNQQPEKLKPEQLQVGSSIGFGFVPQPSLSGRRLTVSNINTYQFGEETLTSFVLAQDKDAGVSMIVAESEGEQYLAISRRVSISDRMRMFDGKDLENIMDNADTTTLACKDGGQDFKGWLVSSYKREIQGLTGRIYRGDFRKDTLPPKSAAQEFQYTLLVSDSNEHAIEIEKYADGRVELYATIYRRVSDIGEISNPSRVELNRPDLKLASDAGAKPVLGESKPTPAVELPKSLEPVKVESPKEEAVKSEPVKSEPIKLAEFEKTPLAPIEPKEEVKAEVKPEMKEVKKQEEKPQPPKVAAPTATNITQEKKPMAMTEPAKNGAADKASFGATPFSSESKQEIKTVSKTANGMENEAIECDLRIANKIIDEAIRNEMRLSDVVRRIIELPVSHQEAVHIPVNLSDEDYALLAIRYGISASDRAAIKRRIFEDLNDFSGGKKKAA